MLALLAALSLLQAATVAAGSPRTPRRASPPKLASQLQLEAALLEAVQASCPQLQARIDPDLVNAARAFVRAVRAGTTEATGDGLSFFASLGTIDPSPSSGVTIVDLPQHADRGVSDLFPRNCHFEQVGVAAAVTKGRAVVAVLTTRRVIALEPLPDRAAPMAVVYVRGSLTDPELAQPRLYHLRPTGDVDDVPLVSDGGRFSMPVRLIEQGEHTLEVLADGPGGPQVVALRRVFAGVSPPVSPPRALPTPPGDGLDAVEHAIASLRHARGLPPLRRDPSLDQIAEKHSNEMARLKTFAHVLPTDRGLRERLVAAGYAYRTAGENIGLAEDAMRAHEAVAQSPAHLMNLLDPRHRKLGLAAVRAPSPEGVSAVWLTEVLAMPAGGSTDPVGDVARFVSAERSRHGLAPIPRSRTLDALALAEVQRVALLDSVTPDPALAQRALDEVPDLRTTATDLLVAGGPEEVSSSKNIGDPGWTQLGIGAIYASSAKYGPGRLWVLILYAR